MDKDNDIETETDSVISSMTDVSIYHEFDQIMAELHSIQQLHHQTIQQCQQLSSSITTLTNDDKIYIICDNKKMDLDDFLDEINMESLQIIKNKNEMSFSKILLDSLSRSTIEYK